MKIESKTKSIVLGGICIEVDEIQLDGFILSNLVDIEIVREMIKIPGIDIIMELESVTRRVTIWESQIESGLKTRCKFKFKTNYRT